MTTTKLKDAVRYINLFGALYLVATTITGKYGIHKIGYYIFFFSYIVEIFIEKKWQHIKWNKTCFYYMGMFLFFLLSFIYYPFDSEKYFKILLERRYALMGFAVVGFLGLNTKYKLSYFINTFTIVSVLLIVYIAIHMDPIWSLFTQEDAADTFTLLRRELVSEHMEFNHYLNLSIIGIWYIIKYSWSHLSKWKRGAYITAMCLFFYVLALSEGRAGFLLGISLILNFVGIEVWEKRKKIKILGALLYPLLLVVLLMFASQHKRIENGTMWKDPRLDLWQASWEIIKERPLLGNGMSRAQELFDAAAPKYYSEEFRIMTKTTFKTIIIDSHNQFIQTAMEFGLVGISLLIFLFAYPLFAVNKHKRLLAFFLLLSCLFESMFNPFIIGITSSVFGLITLMIFCIPDNINKMSERTC